jgi:PAS domain S-box-containing protein
VRYFDLLDALGHAVIATDAKGRITHWNAPAESIYGWTRDEVHGRDVVEVTPADISRQQAREIMRTLAAGEVWSGTFPIHHRNGEAFQACVTDLPLIDGGRRIVGVVGVSAIDCGPAQLSEVLTKLVSAADELWPEQIDLLIDEVQHVTVDTSEPHLLQLLTMLLMRESDALDAGEQFEMVATRETRDIHLRFSRKGEKDHSMERSTYASSLVSLAGGKLFMSRPHGAHLFLPLSEVH